MGKRPCANSKSVDIHLRCNGCTRNIKFRCCVCKRTLVLFCLVSAIRRRYAKVEQLHHPSRGLFEIVEFEITVNDSNNMQIAKRTCKLIKYLDVKLRIARCLVIELQEIPTTETLYDDTIDFILLILYYVIYLNNMARSSLA